MTKKTYKLSMGTVLRKGRKAYENKKLQYQTDKSETGSCMYKLEDGVSCIIGAALPKDFLDIYPEYNDSPIGNLIADGIVKIVGRNENKREEIQAELEDLQQRHDDAVRSIASGTDVSSQKRKFINYFKKLEKKYGIDV